MLKALVRAYRNNLGMYERSLASVDWRALALLYCCCAHLVQNAIGSFQ